MVMVAPTATVTTILANEVEPSRKKKQRKKEKDTKEALVRVIGPSLLIVIFFSFQL
jgi:hypothetical protein